MVKNSYGKKRKHLEGEVVTKNNISWEFSIHGAGSNRNMPGCKILRSGILRPTIPGGANHHNSTLRRMERSNCHAVIQQTRRGTTERHRQHVHAVVDGCVKRRQDVGVEALVAADGGPADLVRRHAGLGRAALGGSEALAEDANSRDGVSGGCGEGVGAMTLLVTWGLKGGVEWARRRGVTLVEVPCTD